MKTVVITGSTRGIGLGLVRAFLEEGCSVVVSGRDAGRVELVRAELAEQYGEDRVLGVACDVRECDAVQGVWDESVARFGSVDVWINNAGISHAQVEVWELTADCAKTIIDTNVLGTIYGARVAIAGMLAQGFGAIYNLEGLGSAGRHVPGTSLYATTKAAVRYFTDALILETRGTALVVGAIRPGMVMTDLILEGLDRESPDWPRAKRIFNILADRVETVTPWIARRVLKNDTTGVRIDWLTRRRVLARFLLAPFRKRNVFG